jgi:AcrR family transcriptional regulator
MALAYRRTERVSNRLAARRAAILAAARDVVARDGFQGLSMQQVAERSGVATGALYRYFASKENLCAETVKGISDRELSVLRRIVGSEGPPLARLWAAINTFTRRAMQARTLAYALMAEPGEPAVDRLRLRYRKKLASVLEGLIDESVADGSLPAQTASASAAFMVGAFIEGVIAPHAPDIAPDGIAALADDIASFCLRGAGADERQLTAARGRPTVLNARAATVAGA